MPRKKKNIGVDDPSKIRPKRQVPDGPPINFNDLEEQEWQESQRVPEEPEDEDE